MKKNLLLLTFLLCITSGLLKSAVYVDTTIVASSGKHKLTIALPNNYSSSKAYRLVLALQPCNGSTYKSYLEALKPITDSMQIIVACLDNSGKAVSDANIDIIRTSLDTVMAMYKIDSTEVYLTGMSCNGEVALRQGLKKVYPFKGIFPYAPYNPSLKDFSSDMPVTIVVGTKDEYSYNQILNTYDSLHAHGADVNLVLIPGATHTFGFADFGKEMIYAMDYLMDSNKIAISKPVNFLKKYTVFDTDAEFVIDFTANHSDNKEMYIRALSSNTAVIDNPQFDYIANDGKIALKIKPKPGKIGKALIVIEAKEYYGSEISQITFNVVVSKNKTSVVTLQSSIFEVFPNPAFDKLYVKSSSSEMNIQITDIYGRIVLKSAIVKDSFIDISGLKSGSYFVSALNNKTVLQTKILVKK